MDEPKLIFFNKLQIQSKKSPLLIIYRPDYSGNQANCLLIDLIKHMLQKDPSTRFSVTDILKHDWVTANGTHSIVIKNYLPVTIEPEDKDKAIGKINAMQLIKVRMKERI